MNSKNLICIVAILSIMFIHDASSEITARFKNAKCTTSSKTLQISKCFVKAYNRKVAKVTIVVNVKKKLNEIFVSANKM
jgi:hypothetical protein